MRSDCQLMCYPEVRLIFLAVLLLMISGTANAQPGRRTIASATEQEIRADVRVERGIFLLYPADHSVVLQEWEIVGMPHFDSLTAEKRLRLAITEFQMAKRHQNQLKAYSAAQVYSHLANSYTALAQELQRQTELLRKPSGSTEIRKSFRESIMFARLALQNEKGDLMYVFGVGLVRAIVSSGNLFRALNTIHFLERSNLRPSHYSDYGLIRIRADIYLVLGRYEDASLAYEEWISKGKTNSFLAPGNALYEKLRDLKHKTGHPNNLPS